MFATADDIEALLISAVIPESGARAIARESKPGVALDTRVADDESEIPVGVTKIGGRPDLPGGLAWSIRPLYHGAMERAAQYREDAERPDNWRKAATQERKDAYRAQAARRMEMVSRAAPLSFVAQFNRKDLCAVGDLDPDTPKSGRLLLFYDR
jgi:hypothetical protein